MPTSSRIEAKILYALFKSSILYTNAKGVKIVANSRSQSPIKILKPTAQIKKVLPNKTKKATIADCLTFFFTPLGNGGYPFNFFTASIILGITSNASPTIP